MTIGERIKARREQLGITQEDLAIALGYKSKSSINKIELGKQELTQRKIMRMAQALQTTVSYIMGWDEAHADLSSAGLSLRDVAYELGITQETLGTLISSGDPESVAKITHVAELLAQLSSKSVDALPKVRAPVSTADLRFALWGDAEAGMTDEDLQDVLAYAEFVRDRKNAKKKDTE